MSEKNPTDKIILHLNQTDNWSKSVANPKFSSIFSFFQLISIAIPKIKPNSDETKKFAEFIFIWIFLSPKKIMYASAMVHPYDDVC